MTHIRFCSAILIIVAFFCSGVQAKGAKSRFTRIITFGESTTDMGNVAQLQCDAGVGESYLPKLGLPLLWSPCTPISKTTDDPLYFDDDLDDGFHGRLSNGPVWIEYLSEVFDLEIKASVAGGTNHAHAGAKAGPDWTTVFSGDPATNLRVNLTPLPSPPNPSNPISPFVPGSNVPTVQTQIQQFLGENQKFTNKDLTFVWIGANGLRDVGRNPGALIGAIPTTEAQDLQNILSNISVALTEIALNGGRHVVVMNQPNVARAPAVVAVCMGNPMCLAGVEGLVNAFNFQLKALVEGLQVALRLEDYPVTFHYIDMYTIGETAFMIPGLFSNITDPALQPDLSYFPNNIPYGLVATDADNYLFWDAIHPTTKAHRLFAFGVCNQLADLIPTGKTLNCPAILQ